MSRKAVYSSAIIVAKLLGTGLAFWLVLRSTDIDAAVAAAKSTAPAGAAIAFGLLLIQVGVSGIRWSALAQSCGIALGAGEAALRFWQSLFFGQFTPSGVGGDAWRIYTLSPRAPAIANAMNSVILDRIIGAAALVLMVLCGFAAAALRGAIIDQGALLAGLGLAVTLAVGVGVLLALRRLPRIAASWDRLGLAALARKLSALTHAALAKPRLLAATLALSILAQMVAAIAAWVLARALGFDPGLGACLVVVPLALLISMIPITIAGWGLREGVIAAGFVHAGATIDVAAAISLLFGLGVAMVGFTGGLLLLVDNRKGPAEGQPAPSFSGSSD